MNNLRDNKDGTCNCKPLGDGCFFTSPTGKKCDCKCHSNNMEWKWKKALNRKLREKGLHLGYKQDNLEVIENLVLTVVIPEVVERERARLVEAIKKHPVYTWHPEGEATILRSDVINLINK